MTFVRDLTIKQIRAFEAVARTRSITKAAEEICVTPPAISSQLKTLQNLIGADIIKRASDGLRPTQIGLEILALSEHLEAAVHLSARKIKAVKDGKSGTVGLAVVSTGKYFAPAIIAAFIQAFPQIKLRPLIGNRQIVLKALATKTVDMAIMGRPPANLDVIAHTLGEHPNILIASPEHRLAGHRLAGGRKIKPSDLLQETLLTRELGSGTRALAIQYMDRIGEGLGYPTMEIGSNESIKQAVMAGLGIAMISAHTVMAELEQGRLVALNMPGLPIIRHWILVHSKHRPLSGATKQFHEFLLENKHQFIPQYSHAPK